MRQIVIGNALDNKIAIITGSGRGIGRSVALAMAQEGASIVTNDCDPEISEAVANEIMATGGQALAFPGDVSDFDLARQMVEKAVDQYGGLDILINNAGTVHPVMVTDMTEEEWDYLININLKGTFNCLRHAAVVMKERGWGRIINTTSIARLGDPEHCNYAASKAGIVGLTRAVAIDLKRYGITCNAYGPHAATRWLFVKDTSSRFDRALESGTITNDFIDKRTSMPSPESVAPLLIYLCTDEAADVNGQIFEIAGNEIELYVEDAKSRIVTNGDMWTIDELKESLPRLLAK